MPSYEVEVNISYKPGFYTAVPTPIYIARYRFDIDEPVSSDEIVTSLITYSMAAPEHLWDISTRAGYVVAKLDRDIATITITVRRDHTYRSPLRLTREQLEHMFETIAIGIRRIVELLGI